MITGPIPVTQDAGVDIGRLALAFGNGLAGTIKRAAIEVLDIPARILDMGTAIGISKYGNYGIVLENINARGIGYYQAGSIGFTSKQIPRRLDPTGNSTQIKIWI